MLFFCLCHFRISSTSVFQKSIHFNLYLPLTLSVHVPQPDYSVCENHFISYQPKEGKKLITDKINTYACSVPYVMVY